MSISRIKQIKGILANGDVRDPRAILIAIEEVLSQPKPKKGDKPIPALKLVAKRTGKNCFDIAITNDNSLTEVEMLGLIETMQKHHEVVFGPVVKKMSIEEIFAAMEADLIKAAGAKKGGAV